MARARRAVADTSLSEGQKQRVQAAALELPDIAVMAGAARNGPSAAAIRKAVASSTALETGQSVAELEHRLQAGNLRPSLKLAR